MSAARLLGSAEDELRSVVRWYDRQQPGLGLEFLGVVHGVLARVGEVPDQFPTWLLNRRFRRAVVPRFPYVLFFHIVSGEAVVVAIAHTSRRPGYWADRVTPVDTGRP